jgi:type I restriction enzyme R subunit
VSRHDETSFESSIESALLTHGWQALDKSTYDLSRHCFPQEALAFIRSTQRKEWARLEALNGAQTEAQVLKDLVHWLDTTARWRCCATASSARAARCGWLSSSPRTA